MTHNITGHHRKAYARQIHRRIAKGMTKPAICIELGITTAQLDGLIRQFPAPLVQVVSGKTAICPVCGNEQEVKNGQINRHQVLGPGRGGIRVAVDCRGSGSRFLTYAKGAK